jgi:hypothetical protein
MFLRLVKKAGECIESGKIINTITVGTKCHEGDLNCRYTEKTQM